MEGGSVNLQSQPFHINSFSYTSSGEANGQGPYMAQSVVEVYLVTQRTSTSNLEALNYRLWSSWARVVVPV